MSDEEYKPRRNSIRLPNFDYASKSHFVTLVTADRQNFFTNEKLADAIIETLLNLKEKQNFNLYSACLMPDHFHATLGIGDSGLTLSRICGAFKSLSTREFWKYHDGKLWQRQFHDHVIRNEQDFAETVKYIRLNPVKAKLVENWQDWKHTIEPDM